MSRYRWPVPPTMSTRVAVSNLVRGEGHGARPDRPRSTDALAHLADADLAALPAEPVDYADAELVARALAIVATMGPQTRAVMAARMDGATLAEAGAAIGRSGQRALQIEREAHARVRDRLARWIDNEPGNWRAGGAWEAA